MTKGIPFNAPPSRLELMEDEIHIFCAPLDLPSARLRQLAETLSADERIRAAHFQFDQDRNRFMAGRGLLREILGWLLRLPPAALIFSYGAHGKPQLAAAPADRWLHFNLAHSDSLAVYAVSCSFEVGVDVERIRHIPEAGQIAAQFFTRSEAAHWRALPPAQQSEFFSDCWTCKEAYLKAIGMGFSGWPNQNETSFAPDQVAELLKLGASWQTDPGWLLYQLKPASGYVGAVIAKNNKLRVVNWTWERSTSPHQDQTNWYSGRNPRTHL